MLLIDSIILHCYVEDILLNNDDNIWSFRKFKFSRRYENVSKYNTVWKIIDNYL